MDLDKLIKLVKLANNNPNDNEANLATRKVCKIIADNNYQFNGHVKQEPNRQQRRQRDADDINDIFNRWYGFRDPFSSQKERSWDYETNHDRYQKAEREAKENNDRKQREKSEQEKKYTWNSMGWEYDPETGKKKKVYIKKTLRCSRCNDFKSTIFDGNPSEFVCGACEWKEWNDSRSNV